MFAAKTIIAVARGVACLNPALARNNPTRECVRLSNCEVSAMKGILKQINRSNGGLPKYAVEGAVMLSASGIEGDVQRDRRFHGGINKAVHDFGRTDRFPDKGGLSHLLRRPRENLTVSGLDPNLWRRGQRYRVGEDAVVELTTLRQPCGNLNIYGPAVQTELYDARCKAGDITSPCWARGGFYGKVIKPGLIIAGAPVILQSDIA